MIPTLRGVATRRQKLTGVHEMTYRVFKHNQAYGPRPGLEGPFHYPNGRVLYYDNKAGEYWDPRTDFYVPIDEVADLQQSIFDRISA